MANENVPAFVAESRLTPMVRRRLFALITIVLVASSLFLSWQSLTLFESSLTPELNKKAEVIGLSAVGDVERAVGLGIPFAELNGVGPYLSEIGKTYPEIEYVAVTDVAGKLLYSSSELSAQTMAFFKTSAALDIMSGPASGRSLEIAAAHNLALPLKNDGKAIGLLHVGIDKQFVQRQLNDIFFDLVIILIVGLLVAIEITLALVTFYVTAPLERLDRVLALYTRGNFSQILVHKSHDAVGSVAGFLEECARKLNERYERVAASVRAAGGAPAARLEDIRSRYGLGKLSKYFEGSIVDARIPLFIFSFAEELQKSFLPLFVKEVYEPVPYLTEEVAIGLPIAFFMGIIALATPFAGGWADKYGSRRIFVIGLIPAVAGYIGCAAATTIYELVAWRSATALGYAMITISCQGYIAAIVTLENRAKGMAVFVGVLMSASMCGTAIGGILADRIGYRLVFVLAAVFALVAGAIAYRMLVADGDTIVTKTKQKGGVFRKLGAVFANMRFVAIVFLAAIPAKIILTGFLYFIVPLYLFSLGSSTAETGRIMMIYPVIVIALGPAASWAADRLGNMMWMLVVGCFASGMGLVFFNDWASVWGVVLMVIVMGSAHAFTKAPQIAFVMEVCEADMEKVGRTTVLGLLRTMERIGSVLGPIIAATLVGIFGYEQAIMYMGLIISGSAVLFLVVFVLTARGSADGPAEGKSGG